MEGATQREGAPRTERAAANQAMTQMDPDMTQIDAWLTTLARPWLDQGLLGGGRGEADAASTR